MPLNDPYLGLGLSQFGEGIGAIGEAYKRRGREKDLEGLWENLLTEPAGDQSPADVFSGARAAFKGVSPKTLARVLGSEAFTPQGLKALASFGGRGASGAGAMLTGEQLQKAFPNLAEADLKGYVFQQNENGDWIPRVQPKRPVVAAPGSAILDSSGTQLLAKVPERLQVANLSQGGQLRLVDPNSGENFILAERAPAPSGGSGGTGGGGTPNVILQVPDVGENGQPITRFIEFERGKAGAPGRPVQELGTGTKAPPKPLSSSELEGINQVRTGIRALGMMENLVKRGGTGRIKGLQSRAESWLGTDKDAVDFRVAKDQLRLGAQAIVPGIPSNFDVELVMNTQPSEFDPKPLANAKINFLRSSFKDMIETKIAFFKGTNTQLPPDLYAIGEQLGISVDKVPELSQEQTIQRVQKLNAQMRERVKLLGGQTTPIAPGTPQAVKPVTGGGPSIDELLKKYAPGG